MSSTGSGEWEEVVNQVTIPGHPVNLAAGAQGWANAFETIRRLKGVLASVIRTVSDPNTFGGKTASALATHLAKIHDSLDQIEASHVKIVQALYQSAQDLAKAVSAIPIPSYVAPDVLKKQADYEEYGRFEPFKPNEFFDRMPFSSYFLARGHPSLNSLSSWIPIERFWYSYHYHLGTAASALAQLEEDYAKVPFPTGTPVDPPRLGADSPVGRRGPGSLSDATIPTGPVTPASFPNAAGINGAGLPGGLNTPGLGNLDTSNLDTPDFDSSGLSSDDALSGLGGGKLAGLGGGLGGADPFGGAGVSRLGPLVSPDAMLGGPPATAARLAAAAGTGGAAVAANPGMGVVPAGLGAGLAQPRPGETPEHTSRLTEQDPTIFAARPEDEARPPDVIT